MSNNENYQLVTNVILENGQMIKYDGYLPDDLLGVNIRLKMPSVSESGDEMQIDTNYNMYVGEEKSILELFALGVRLSSRCLRFCKEQQIYSMLVKNSSIEKEVLDEHDVIIVHSCDKQCESVDVIRGHVSEVYQIYEESFIRNCQR